MSHLLWTIHSHNLSVNVFFLFQRFMILTVIQLKLALHEIGPSAYFRRLKDELNTISSKKEIMFEPRLKFETQLQFFKFGLRIKINKSYFLIKERTLILV